MTASQSIPNFTSTIANHRTTLAFYLTAGTYKLLKKYMGGDHTHQHQLDAMLLLLTMTIPESSAEALTTGGVFQ